MSTATAVAAVVATAADRVTPAIAAAANVIAAIITTAKAEAEDLESSLTKLSFWISSRYATA